ncbi:hypothetical protein BH09BAC3_BH09BAC3_15270 [soil metagenome]
MAKIKSQPKTDISAVLSDHVVERKYRNQKVLSHHRVKNAAGGRSL